MIEELQEEEQQLDNFVRRPEEGKADIFWSFEKGVMDYERLSLRQE